MKATVLVLLVVLGVAVVLSIPTGTAAALEPTPHPTVYATDAHMWFSIRMSLVRWLGGTTEMGVERGRMAATGITAMDPAILVMAFCHCYIVAGLGGLKRP